MEKYVDVETVRTIAHDYLCVQQDEDAFMEEISNAATSDVAPVRHGTWGPMFDNPYALFNRDTAKVSGIHCSCCGHVFNVELEIRYASKYNYCPYCGAKMDDDR